MVLIANRFYKQNTASSLDSLVEEMNRAVANGYRLVSAIRHYYVALMKFDEGQYEYQHFELLNNFTRWGVNFNEQHDRLTRNGFRFVDFYAIYDTREVFNPSISTAEEWEWTNTFFYEKDKSTRQPNKQILVTSLQSKGKQPSEALPAQVKQKLSEGYYPVGVFSPAEMLLEQAAAKDDLIDEELDVQIVGAVRTGEAERKINALAKQGYRVGLARNAVVVLYHRQTDSPPVSYVLLESKNKNFEKQLIKLQTQGAIYRTVYYSLKDDWNNVLIFEVPPTSDGKRREYKALRFDFDVTDNEAENKWHMELTATSKETLQTMERLIKQGFEARDLFMWNGKPDVAGVLLERESN